MMYKNAIIYLLMFLLIGNSCQSQNKDTRIKEKSNQSLCEPEQFVGSDTSGVFKGTVLIYHEFDPNRSYRYLWLLDSLGDTISFRIILPASTKVTKNVLEEKLKPDVCVTVSYVTDIVSEEGIELNRFYYATRLDYP